jgi:hypothetical protein
MSSHLREREDFFIKVFRPQYNIKRSLASKHPRHTKDLSSQPKLLYLISHPEDPRSASATEFARVHVQQAHVLAVARSAILHLTQHLAHHRAILSH